MNFEIGILISMESPQCKSIHTNCTVSRESHRRLISILHGHALLQLFSLSFYSLLLVPNTHTLSLVICFLFQTLNGYRTHISLQDDKYKTYFNRTALIILPPSQCILVLVLVALVHFPQAILLSPPRFLVVHQARLRTQPTPKAAITTCVEIEKGFTRFSNWNHENQHKNGIRNTLVGRWCSVDGCLKEKEKEWWCQCHQKHNQPEIEPIALRDNVSALHIKHHITLLKTRNLMSSPAKYTVCVSRQTLYESVSYLPGCHVS